MSPLLRLGLPAALVLLPGAGCDRDAGERVSLVAVRESDDALVQVEVDGRTARSTRLLATPGESVAYRPVDGRSGVVTMTRVTEGAAESLRCAIGTLDVTRGELTWLTDDGPDAVLSLSPDGRTRYVLTSPDSCVTTALVRTDASGGAATTLVEEVDGTELSSASPSPDGRTVYVARVPGEGPSELLAVDTASGARRTVPVRGLGDAAIHHVVVSPDGGTLALTVAGQGAATRVGLVPADGGDVRFADGDAWTVSWTPGGRLVLTVVEDDVRHLALADPRTLEATPLADTEGLGNAVAVARRK